MPHWLRLRTPDRDTVLYPELAYPTYEMGALLAGVPCGARAGEARRHAWTSTRSPRGRRPGAVPVGRTAPANPTGQLDDLAAAAEWGRRHAVPVFSDECYAEFTWDGAGRARSSSTATRAWWRSTRSRSARTAPACGSASTPATRELVNYLVELRRHAGFMVPGPIQHAAAVALEDDEHVDRQRAVYHERLRRFAAVLERVGIPAAMPAGAFYLWVPVPARFAGDEVPLEDGTVPSPAFALARWLAAEGGVLVSPGDTYGPVGRGHVRVALVQPDERIDLVAARLESAVS